MLFSPSHPKGLILKLNKLKSSFESSNKSFLPFCVNLTFTMKGSRPSERLACKQGFKARHGKTAQGHCTAPLKEAGSHLLPLHLWGLRFWENGKRVKYRKSSMQSIEWPSLSLLSPHKWGSCNLRQISWWWNFAQAKETSALSTVLDAPFFNIQQPGSDVKMLNVVAEKYTQQSHSHQKLSPSWAAKPRRLQHILHSNHHLSPARPPGWHLGGFGGEWFWSVQAES